MKRLSLIILIFFFLIVIQYHLINAQEWINLNPFNQPPGNTLFGIDFVDEQNGWVVGEWGIILHTPDGGETWQVQQNHTIDYDLRRVDFIDQLNGWAVGEWGTIYHTTDGGQNWHKQASPTSILPLNDVVFVNDNSGWIVGFNGLILHTNDGGKNWHTQPSTTEHELLAVSFVDNCEGWAVGTYGIILHTRDGGLHWEIQNNNVNWYLKDVVFVDSLHGWALGSYTGEEGILRTTNGGVTWDKILTLGNTMALSAISADEAWIVGWNGLIKHTNNGGLSWQAQNSNTGNTLYDVKFLDSNTGWTIGWNGLILHTENGGKNWKVQHIREVNYSISGTFISAMEGWMVARGQLPQCLYHTLDAGLTWSIQMKEGSTFYSNFEFVDDIYGWMKVYKEVPSNRPPFYEYFLWRTKNGGNSWQQVSSPPDSAFFALHFVDSLIGYSGGTNSIYRTTDGGESWQKMTIEPGVHFGLWDIYFVNEQYGWAVGGSSDIFDAGIIVKTTDGGENWQVNLHPSGVTGMGVYFTDQLHGFVVGSNPPCFDGVIYHTTDGGQNWDVQYLPGSWLNDVLFTDDSTGWVAGDYGYLWHTTDGGSTWQRMETGTHADLHRIVFVDNGKAGYIFGDNNTLLRYDSTGSAIKIVNSITPSILKLYQNYPNPFNSETIIEYELKQPASVILKVYNITGKEVITLVDENQIGGSYHIIWNGRNNFGKEVSSGVYFCLLRVGSFNQTRKMLLVR